MKTLTKIIRATSLALIAGCFFFSFTYTVSAGGVKVQVCHKGEKELVIGASAVQSHLDNHDDCLGACPCD